MGEVTIWLGGAQAPPHFFKDYNRIFRLAPPQFNSKSKMCTVHYDDCNVKALSHLQTFDASVLNNHSHENNLFSREHRLRTFCFHENIACEHFVFMRTSHANAGKMENTNTQIRS